MFNLLQGIDCVEGWHQISISRIYSDEGDERTLEFLNQRAELPTIAMHEGAPLSDELAMFCKLSRLTISGNELSFWLSPTSLETSFPASLLDENKYVHQLSDSWNWHHTCWQFGKGNIYETLFHAKNADAELRCP